jgi:ABC-2 type transport system permease protein
MFTTFFNRFTEITLTPGFLIPAALLAAAIGIILLMRMTTLWAIIRNTFLQTIRQPVFSVLIGLLYFLLVMGFLLSNWAISPSGDHQDQDQRLMVNVSLSTLMAMGMLVAVFSASSVLAREIDDKTALTVVSKPVGKGTFVLGKFFGVAGAVTLACYLGALAMLMLCRHRVLTNASDPVDYPVIVLGISALVLAFGVAIAGNFMFGWTFTTAVTWLQVIFMTLAMGAIAVIGKGWTLIPFGQGIEPNTLQAIYALLLIVWVLTAVAIAASTRLGQISTLMVCIGFAIAGGYHQLFFGAWAGGNQAIETLGLAMPDTRYFLLMESILRDAPIRPEYLLVLTGYAGLLIAAVLSLGIGMFQTRQLEAVPSAGGPGGVNLLAGVGRVLGVVLMSLAIVRFFSPELSWSDRVGGFVALAVSGGVLWTASGALGRGRAWGYLTTSILALSILGLMFTTLITSDEAMRLVRDRMLPGQIAILAVLATAVLIICGLPSTLRHVFRSSSV